MGWKQSVAKYRLGDNLTGSITIHNFHLSRLSLRTEKTQMFNEKVSLIACVRSWSCSLRSFIFGVPVRLRQRVHTFNGILARVRSIASGERVSELLLGWWLWKVGSLWQSHVPWCLFQFFHKFILDLCSRGDILQILLLRKVEVASFPPGH